MGAGRDGRRGVRGPAHADEFPRLAQEGRRAVFLPLPGQVMFPERSPAPMDPDLPLPVDLQMRCAQFIRAMAEPQCLARNDLSDFSPL